MEYKMNKQEMDLLGHTIIDAICNMRKSVIAINQLENVLDNDLLNEMQYPIMESAQTLIKLFTTPEEHTSENFLANFCDFMYGKENITLDDVITNKVSNKEV